jgi:predicted Zn finger-like uncharacterized protein
MLIACPTCASEYDLPDGSVGPMGRKVRCASCKNVWTAIDPAAPEPDAPAEPEPVAAPALIEDDFDAEAIAAALMKGDPSMAKPQPVPAEEPTASDSEDQNSIDALFDDIPSEPEAEEPSMALVASNDDPAADDPLPVSTLAPAAPLVAKARPRRGLVQFEVLKNQATGSRNARFAIAAVVLVLAGLMALVAFRQSVVAAVPQTAALFRMVGLEVNLRGLEIVNIRSEMSEVEGAPVLVVHGEVVNPTNEARPVPRLYLAVLDGAETEQYGWTAALDKATLDPGESLAFRRRLASPPPQGRKVLVRFVMEGDPQPAPEPPAPDDKPATP